MQGGPCSSVFGEVMADKNDSAISAAICAAIQHVRRISHRDHLKSDRIERVNLFMTSLRRELSQHLPSTSMVDYHRRTLVEALTDKSIWHDVGILHVGAKIQHLSRAQVEGWLADAEVESYTVKGQAYDIETDLDILQSDMERFRTLNRRADRIAKEGEELLGELTDALVK